MKGWPGGPALIVYYACARMRLRIAKPAINAGMRRRYQRAEDVLPEADLSATAYANLIVSQYDRL
ncbi:MAG: hypothetical protein KGZ54_11195 [Dethiobacter sp.]|nr:hypothetical protein [Dethiobacter sp.]